MESRWRQNLADYGWWDSQYRKLARGPVWSPGYHIWYWQRDVAFTAQAVVQDPGPVGTEHPVFTGFGGHWPSLFHMEPDHPPP